MKHKSCQHDKICNYFKYNLIENYTLWKKVQDYCGFCLWMEDFAFIIISP
jgi:hypothetical protein